MEPEIQVVPYFEQEISLWSGVILKIPDSELKACLLSVFYYYAEFSFGCSNPWYVPKRLLTGNITLNAANDSEASRNFPELFSDLVQKIYFYDAEKNQENLRVLKVKSIAILKARKLEIVSGLENIAAKASPFS